MNNIEKVVKNFYSVMLKNVKKEIEIEGTLDPRIHVLTTSKQPDAFDVNVMEVPSLVDLMENGTPKEVVEARELIEGFIHHLSVIEGKEKIAIFHSEVFMDENGEYLYTYEMCEDKKTVYRYKINRKNIEVNNIGNIVNQIDFEVLDVL